MARQSMSTNVDSKRRRMTDKAHGPGRRNARQDAARRAAIVEAQAAADPSVSAPSTRDVVDVESGDSCRDSRGAPAQTPRVTTASASRSRLDAEAAAAMRVPRATGSSTRKSKRAAAGSARVSASRASAKGAGVGASGMRRKPPLAGRASAAKKSSGVTRTAKKRGG